MSRSSLEPAAVRASAHFSGSPPPVFSCEARKALQFRKKRHGGHPPLRFLAGTVLIVVALMLAPPAFAQTESAQGKVSDCKKRADDCASTCARSGGLDICYEACEALLNQCRNDTNVAIAPSSNKVNKLPPKPPKPDDTCKRLGAFRDGELFRRYEIEADRYAIHEQARKDIEKIRQDLASDSWKVGGFAQALIAVKTVADLVSGPLGALTNTGKVLRAAKKLGKVPGGVRGSLVKAGEKVIDGYTAGEFTYDEYERVTKETLADHVAMASLDVFEQVPVIGDLVGTVHDLADNIQTQKEFEESKPILEERLAALDAQIAKYEAARQRNLANLDAITAIKEMIDKKCGGSGSGGTGGTGSGGNPSGGGGSAGSDDRQNDRPHEIDGCTVPGFVGGQDPCEGELGRTSTRFGRPQGEGDTGVLRPGEVVEDLPCNNHDICYQTCGADKTQCDEQMYEDMLEVCRGAYPEATCPLDDDDVCDDWEDEKSDCNWQAWKYKKGLDLFGGKAYRDRQKQYCKPKQSAKAHEVDGCSSSPDDPVESVFNVGRRYNIPGTSTRIGSELGVINDVGAYRAENGDADLDLPCNKHDLCYQTCGASKADCDQAFENDILAVCERAYGDSCPWTEATDCDAWDEERQDCRFSASAYRKGVEWQEGLLGSFAKRQAEYCVSPGG